jgi:tRNA G18 (ribose-2'-O)-methylase SpoU
MPHEGEQAARPKIERPCALVIGNEGRGVSEEFRSLSQAVSIPTAGVESLNASIAAAILLYEAYRG